MQIFERKFPAVSILYYGLLLGSHSTLSGNSMAASMDRICGGCLGVAAKESLKMVRFKLERMGARWRRIGQIEG